MPVLEMKAIVKDFPGLRALDHVDFSCEGGEIHCLVGENGAGKSTLMKILAGIYRPDGGEIWLRGEKATIRGVPDARRLGIGMVFQELSLIPSLSVMENIFAGVYPKTSRGLLDWRKMRKRAETVLAEVGLAVDPRCPVRDLPLAERQLIEISKILVHGARLIVLDEPTAALSRREVERLFTIMKKLKNQGRTIIFISHRLREVLEVADHITVLKDGKRVGTVPREEVDEERLIQMMVGRELSDLFPPRSKGQEGEEVLFAVENLSVEGKVHEVSFAVKKGKILGIGGLEGQGQRELLRAIFGLERKKGGRILVGRREIFTRSPEEARRQGIALIPEDRQTEGIFSLRSVRENITLTTLEERQRFGVIDVEQENRVLQGIVEELAIKVVDADQEVSSLSGGNLQKVVLGRWLIARPKVLLLLEPTRGVDVATKSQIYHLLRKLADEGVAIVLYSSDMIELIGLCDQVLVMYEGRVVEILEGEEISEETLMRAAVGKGRVLQAG